MRSDTDPCDDCGHPYIEHLQHPADPAEPCSTCDCPTYQASTARASVRLVARHARARLRARLRR